MLEKLVANLQPEKASKHEAMKPQWNLDEAQLHKLQSQAERMVLVMSRDVCFSLFFWCDAWKANKEKIAGPVGRLQELLAKLKGTTPALESKSVRDIEAQMKQAGETKVIQVDICSEYEWYMMLYNNVSLRSFDACSSGFRFHHFIRFHAYGGWCAMERAGADLCNLGWLETMNFQIS